MKKQNLIVAFVLVLSTLACKKEKNADLENGIYAKFDTNYGDFTAQLYYKKAPMTVANFVSLAEGNNPMADKKYNGKKFFDGLTFHRVIDGFMIQGGDPEGTGRGGPGYKFPDETDTGLKHDTIGVLSMANSGPNTNGSQFFITLAPTPNLNGHYSVFGQIVKGQNVVDSIGKVDVKKPANKPVEDVVMKSVKIIRKGQDAKDFNAPKVFKDHIEKSKEEEKAQKEKIEKEVSSMAEGFKKTDSGLRYKITKKVKQGKKPKPGQTVQVYYKGMLKDGKVFDQRLEKDGKPITFKVGTGRVIQGWDEGLQLLKEGESARLIIPPYLAYGPGGRGPIPPNAILIFDVTLAKIGK